MNAKLLSLIPLAGLLLTTLFYFPHTALAEEPKLFIPDKAFCAKMLRFGKQAYVRGKYLNAKEYFRKAVQADPTSSVAWRYYDQAVIFALAEKVEKNADLTLPDTSVRGEKGAAATVSPPPPTPKPADKGEEVDSDDEEEEGC